MKRTKIEQVKWWFLNNPDRGFTTTDALRECHTTELRKKVCTLIDRGLAINRDRWLQVSEDCKVKLYYVTKAEVIRYCQVHGISLNELQWYKK